MTTQQPTTQQWTTTNLLPQTRQIIAQLQQKAQPDKVAILSSFFKSTPGAYGEGDRFLGIKVPDNRVVAKSNTNAPQQVITQLFHSPYHEHRLCAALILVAQFTQAGKEAARQTEIFNFYLSQHKRINNWDLVDLTAPQIVGGYLLQHPNNELLYQMAQQGTLWQQRIAIVATLALIKQHQFAPTLHLATLLINHPHDLIQKAVGWMLREIGKRDFNAEFNFLTHQQRYKHMPRTMLRYAIEKFDEPLRQQLLKGEL